ncbi:MAG TPA: hypothetical protein VGD67_23325 [Pseudonocardiaceae bacterium]
MRTGTVTTLLALTVVAAGLGGCGLLDQKHAVGECVRTRVSLGGTDLTSADCPASPSAFDPSSLTDPVYRITQVLELDGSCPSPEGFGGIELRHEPDDAVYCLTPALG